MKEPYKITMHRFEGVTPFGYQYVLTLNQSMISTGRHKAIEEALDNYGKRKWQKLWIAVKNLFAKN